MEKAIIFIASLIPTLYEAWSDRKGENVKSKRKDAIWLSVYALALSLLGWLFFHVLPFKTIALIIGFRIAFFDYLVNAFLKRYSEGHRNINIWRYTGTTAFTDRIVSKVPWVIRLLVRVILFVIAVCAFHALGR
jgi:hypothetical protein